MTGFDNIEINTNLDNEMYKEQEPSFSDKIKPYKGTIFKIIILLIILGTLYYFFFFRYTNVSFEVYNYDTNTYEITTLSLEKEGKTINIDTDEFTKLIPGEYLINFSGEISKMYNDTPVLEITKEDNDSTITIYLYPEWTKYISNFNIIEPPKEIYQNQEVSLKVSLNNSGKPIYVTLKGTNALSSINYPVELKTGENTFNLSFINTNKQKEDTKGRIYIDKAKDIKYTNEFNATTKKSPTFKINSKTAFETSSGKELKISFELINSSTEDIQNLNLKLDNANMDVDILNSWVKELPKDINLGPKLNTVVDLILEIPLLEYFEGKKTVTFNAIFENSYANATKGITINYTSPEIEVPTKNDFGTIIAGNNITKELEIENSTIYPITINESKITITSLTKNLESEIYKTITPEDIDSIAPGTNKIPVFINIPYDFVTDKIEGYITLITDLGNIEIPFTLNVSGIDVKLELQNLQSSYNFDFENDFSVRQNKELVLKNSGNADINVSLISMKNCNTEIGISQLNYPFRINKGESQKFYLILKENLPKNSSNFSQPQICYLKIDYIDPRIGTLTSKEDSFQITAN